MKNIVNPYREKCAETKKNLNDNQPFLRFANNIVAIGVEFIAVTIITSPFIPFFLLPCFCLLLWFNEKDEKRKDGLRVQDLDNQTVEETSSSITTPLLQNQNQDNIPPSSTPRSQLNLQIIFLHNKNKKPVFI